LPSGVKGFQGEQGLSRTFKIQPPKFKQIPKFKLQQEFLEFGIWNFPEFWLLNFGVFNRYFKPVRESIRLYGSRKGAKTPRKQED